MYYDQLDVEDQKLLEVARERFLMQYRRQPSHAARAPGRVNLIGDHIDYCDGFVLPVALSCSTIVVGGYNGRSECRVTSVKGTGEVVDTQFPVHTQSTPLTPGSPEWANYVKGVIANFPCEVRGFDIVLVTNVPIGSGLSSSAALEVSIFTFLEALTGKSVDPKKKALSCQKAEHEFAGMPCGIMDQFISVMGKADHALLIDCKSLESTHIPIQMDDIAIMVTNSNVKHKLTGSEYPQRRAQCEEAVAALGKKSMRDITLDDLKELVKLNVDEVVSRRAEHAVSETMRTEQAALHLKNGDFAKVGELFYASHRSLSTLMEVSCPELDDLIEIHRTVRGVLGARMTGGGFGGCTVALVHKKDVDTLKAEINSKYQGKPSFINFQPSHGACIVLLK